MNKVEHIGIAVADLEQSTELYRRLLSVEPYKTETVATEKVITRFFRTGDQKIELLAATDEGSPIARFLQSRGEGIHHIAFAVADILAEMERLKSEGFTLLNEVPQPGADNKLVCFVHPKSAGGVLVELCQERSE